jgi:hypothetical protein
LLDYSLQVYLQTPSIRSCRFIQRWPWSAYLQIDWITTCAFISRLGILLPTSSHYHGIEVHIFLHIPLWPGSVDCNSLDHGTQVHFQSCGIMTWE